MLIPFIKSLHHVPGVSFHEEAMFEALLSILKEHNIDSSLIHSVRNSALIVGNPHAPFFVSAHIDEVGGKIIKEHEKGVYEITGVGWVTPKMLAGESVNVCFTGKEYPSIITYDTPLDIGKITSFQKLRLRSADTSVSFPSETVFRYPPYFYETDEYILANALDNRLGVAEILTYLITQKDRIDFTKIAFVFPGAEETESEGLKDVFSLYSPKIVLTLDMLPHSFLSSSQSMETVYFLKKTNDYTINTFFLPFLKGKNILPLISSFSLLEDSEQKLIESWTKNMSLGLYTPVYNYHHGVYLLSKKTLQSAYEQTEKVIDEIQMSLM
jgi:putative aminopeptidase FrvX